MANKTLLDGVNEVLKRVHIVSTTNPLFSLTNGGKQTFIDLAVQTWNEAVDQLYSKSRVMKPLSGAESQITLVLGIRDYPLAADLVQIRWPFHDETEGRYIYEFEGGYEELRHLQTQPDNYTGQPIMGAINPITGQVYLDRVPTSSEVGDVYQYFYLKDTGMELETDTMPFGDAVFRSMVPVVSEMWKMEQTPTGSSVQTSTREATLKKSMGRAIRLVKQQPSNPTYIKRRTALNTGPLGFDPYGA